MPLLTRPRRAEPRYLCGRWHTGRLIHWPSLASRWAVLRDVSRRGLGLVAEEAFPPGSVVALQLPPGPTGVSGSLVAKVRYALPQDDGFWRLGASLFRPLTDEELLALL